MFEGRIRQSFIDEGYSHDIVDSVLPKLLVNCVGAQKTATELTRARNENPASFKQLVETAVRVARLSAKGQGGPINTGLLSEGIEQDAYQVFAALSDQPSLAELIALSETLHGYFESILVMDQDEQVKQNRLAFLNACHEAYKTQSNFEAIQV